MVRRLPHSLEKIEAIRINQRFGTYSARLNGKRVFVKQARMVDAQAALAREIWGLTTFGQLADGSPLPFEVPRLLTSGQDHLVTTWAPGKPVRLSPTSTNATLLASVYASVDQATLTVKRGRSHFSLADHRGKDIAHRLQKLTARLPSGQPIDPELLDCALERIRLGSSNLVARLTHADLQPDHLLRTSNGRLTVVDYESCSLLWPRFYDVVNHAVNAVIRFPSFGPYAALLLESYFDQIRESPRKHSNAVNTIAAVRAVSSLYEYATPPSDLHNTTDGLTSERIEVISAILSTVVSDRPLLRSRVLH